VIGDAIATTDEHLDRGHRQTSAKTATAYLIGPDGDEGGF